MTTSHSFKGTLQQAFVQKPGSTKLHKLHTTWSLLCSTRAFHLPCMSLSHCRDRVQVCCPEVQPDLGLLGANALPAAPDRRHRPHLRTRSGWRPTAGAVHLSRVLQRAMGLVLPAYTARPLWRCEAFDTPAQRLLSMSVDVVVSSMDSSALRPCSLILLGESISDVTDPSVICFLPAVGSL